MGSEMEGRLCSRCSSHCSESRGVRSCHNPHHLCKDNGRPGGQRSLQCRQTCARSLPSSVPSSMASPHPNCRASRGSAVRSYLARQTWRCIGCRRASGCRPGLRCSSCHISDSRHPNLQTSRRLVSRGLRKRHIARRYSSRQSCTCRI